ncbi:MAG: sulfatase-like hydrolase/transferase, partial [Candidatus Latescibacteria bacterium]|nr:sulfatase-like hydrolase/transferase [Candidatus Latescibacterota bacterium]
MSDQPNILCIVSDQMVAALTGVYGHPVVQTPNLDRLANQGVRFDNAYTPFPLCSPGRAC